MIITNQDELIHFCKGLREKPFVTVDTEFLREKTYYPKLCLVQLSDPEGNARAIDPLTGDLNLNPLYDLLADPNVLKVFHAGRQDLEIFYNLTGKVVTPFFDTQIAAMVCGFGDSAGYESLVRNILNEKLDKSSQFTDWSNRPLSQKQIDYALGDVTYLVKIYEYLSQMLKEKGRTSWVYQEDEILADPKTYSNDPQTIWERIKIRSPRPKTLAILRDLAAWREEKAQERDIPRTWVMRDETLADLASQAPETIEGLARIRNMPKDLPASATGQTLLDVIKTATKSDKKKWPKLEKKTPLQPTAIATVDILKLLLKVQCTQHGVATKLVASNDEIEQIAVEQNPDTPAMKGWRYEIFGRYAQELKKGDLAIGLKDDTIALCKVSKTSDHY